ncbi:glycosyltransferase family 2 protein [Frigoriglobus tundricola]|uniref:GT2 family glycosyltransferase n=1 Tax=Frigoriglobus tundricola TaxID=2774151 RepID=A0A6M5YJN8_9BACT|nr:glycosyltransferase family 2 protein [Frigoriglobus tundricola]QJW94299.1 GT2 family glycosyltransferase [Frigoriglobus tundricola]
MTPAAPRVAVVVVNYNGTDDTHKCLKSLRELDYPNAEIVLVDNGSKPQVGAAFASAYPWVRVIQNPVNGGWAGGNNVGIRDALARGADHFVLLNNDTVVAPALVTRLLAGLSAGYGVVGPLVHWMDEPDVVMMDGCTFDAPGSVSFFDRVTIGAPPAITDVEIVYGCCLTTTAEVIRRIGLLDERFFLIHEESDFCLRARRAGFRCGVLPETLVWHKGSSSFQREGKPLQRYFDARNLFLLMWKHVGSYRRPPTRLRSWLKYLKHVYYFYCVCRDKGNDAGATAVLEGLSDALCGHYGPLKARPRPLVPVLRWVFEGWRQRKGTPG